MRDSAAPTDTVILVTSCDAFADCWEPFSHGLRRYWPDCPFPVHLICNELDFKDPVIKPLRISPDLGWARNLRYAIERLQADIIIYSHEDFWIQSPVDTAAIAAYVQAVRAGVADYIRLYPAPPPDRPLASDARLGILADNAPYRTSLQMAIWRVDVLLELLRDDESCWHFELRGTRRSRCYGNRFLCVRGHPAAGNHAGIDYVCTAINKGLWSRGARDYAAAEGLTIDFSKRGHETWWHEYRRDHSWAMQVDRVLRGLRQPGFVLNRVGQWVSANGNSPT